MRTALIIFIVLPATGDTPGGKRSLNFAPTLTANSKTAFVNIGRYNLALKLSVRLLVGRRQKLRKQVD